MESSRATCPVAQGDREGPSHVVYDVASLPGFRFHPTEEELVGFYLRSMVVGSPRLEVELINVLDLYRYDPWELPAMAFMQGEHEWLFFCPRDRKYPNGERPNRVTASGYWKATGTDRQVRRAYDAKAIGLKKTLVFYTGKAPRGRKTDWIMNEYRLPQNEQHLRSLKDPREVALCRIYRKPAPNPCTTTVGFDLTMEEGLGAGSSTFTSNPCGRERDIILHNASPCASTSRSSPTSPSSPSKLPSFSPRPTPGAICATDQRAHPQGHELRSPTTSASSQHQQVDVPRTLQTRASVKMETGTLSSVLYPCREKLESVDARLPQLIEIEDPLGRSPHMSSPQIPGATSTPGVPQQDVFPETVLERVRDHAACSNSPLNPSMSASFDRWLKATMSPLAIRDDLMPVISTSTSLFSVNQVEWKYSSSPALESPWLHSSSSLSARQSLLQIQGLQDHYQY